jgi:RimK family alpha-L-glutamate ligase
MRSYDLTVFTGGNKAYAPKRLSREAKKAGIKMRVLLYRYLSIKITQDKLKVTYKGKLLSPSKGVFLRGLGEDSVYNPIKYYLVYWYELHGGRVLNGDSFIKWPSLDKTIQYLELYKEKFPIVESRVFGSKETPISWGKNISFPVIVKNNTGSCGTEVYKITSKKKLEKLVSTFTLRSVKSYLFQDFLKGAEDLRVIVVNKKVVGAMKRIAQKRKFLTNFSQGGIIKFYDIGQDKEARELALKVARIFNLDYCGVDLMKDKEGHWVVIEVNRACQFQGFEKATGINVARKVIDFLVFGK